MLFHLNSKNSCELCDIISTFIRKPVRRSENHKITQVVSVIDGIQIQAQFQCDFYLSQLPPTK